MENKRDSLTSGSGSSPGRPSRPSQGPGRRQPLNSRNLLGLPTVTVPVTEGDTRGPGGVGERQHSNDAEDSDESESVRLLGSMRSSVDASNRDCDDTGTPVMRGKAVTTLSAGQPSPGMFFAASPSLSLTPPPPGEYQDLEDIMGSYTIGAAATGDAAGGPGIMSGAVASGNSDAITAANDHLPHTSSPNIVEWYPEELEGNNAAASLLEAAAAGITPDSSTLFSLWSASGPAASAPAPASGGGPGSGSGSGSRALAAAAAAAKKISVVDLQRPSGHHRRGPASDHDPGSGSGSRGRGLAGPGPSEQDTTAAVRGTGSYSRSALRSERGQGPRAPGRQGQSGGRRREESSKSQSRSSAALPDGDEQRCASSRVVALCVSVGACIGLLGFQTYYTLHASKRQLLSQVEDLQLQRKQENTGTPALKGALRELISELQEPSAGAGRDTTTTNYVNLLKSKRVNINNFKNDMPMDRGSVEQDFEELDGKDKKVLRLALKKKLKRLDDADADADADEDEEKEKEKKQKEEEGAAANGAEETVGLSYGIGYALPGCVVVLNKMREHGLCSWDWVRELFTGSSYTNIPMILACVGTCFIFIKLLCGCCSGDEEPDEEEV